MKKKAVFIPFFLVLMLMAAFVSGAATSAQATTGDFIDDSVITTKVKALLAEDDFLKSFKIHVKSQKGIVQLRGSVKSREAVDKAIEITRNVEGVKAVRNKLIVKK